MRNQNCECKPPKNAVEYVFFYIQKFEGNNFDKRKKEAHDIINKSADVAEEILAAAFMTLSGRSAMLASIIPMLQDINFLSNKDLINSLIKQIADELQQKNGCQRTGLIDFWKNAMDLYKKK